MTDRNAKIVTFNRIKDKELLDFLEDKKFSTYCKELIREDMERQKAKPVAIVKNEIALNQNVVDVFKGYEEILAELKEMLKNSTITSNLALSEDTEETNKAEYKPVKINKRTANSILGVLK